jgi:hypothetical protein
MNNNATIVLHNGLGDKLLDLIGFYVICKYLNYKPNVTFNNDNHWGSYDMQLFNLKDISILNGNSNSNGNNFYINSPNPSSSLCPYKVYVFLKNFLPNISFEQISNAFVLYAKEIIKPSEIIMSKIPNGIEKAYGIHLRKSDKVQNNNSKMDVRHISTVNDFLKITNKLLRNVENIIKTEANPIFLIVSEDYQWKIKITRIIVNIAIKNNKQIKILNIDYTNGNNYNNYNSILDMFCLSKCKEILQGVKYSTFSILASILGNGKLRNYANHISSYNICLIHTWNSVIEINNKKNIDIEIHKRITNSVSNLTTNIEKIYE